MDLITKPTVNVEIHINAYLAGRPPNTQRNYATGIKQLLGFLRDLDMLSGKPSSEQTSARLLTVSALEAKAWLHTLGRDYAPGTIGVWLSGVSRFYDYLASEEIVARNPFRSPLIAFRGGKRLPRNRTPRIPEDAVKDLWSAAMEGAQPERTLALLACLFGGSLRRCEVVNLKIGDVREMGDYVALVLRDTKTDGGEVLQSLPDWAGEMVMDWVGEAVMNYDAKDSDSLFGLSVSGLHKVWKRLCEYANVVVPSEHPHIWVSIPCSDYVLWDNSDL